ncbi:flagellar basal-body MS-ring/collar protein FliF [Bacillus gobiensis]|uniref:flagellar basal-body MS-ring/collar protein FliF n=1 Tax=Bacillus gobiensis TaxID=1441095 RepID=UPI003D22CA72
MSMNVKKITNKINDIWMKYTKTQKRLVIGGIAAVIIIILLAVIFFPKENLVPLYKDLSAEETGQIKQTLDEKGVTSELDANGTVIKVPADRVNSLKVELAAEGVPKSGEIDYSFFGQSVGFGMTDNEFEVLKVDAMQTELSNLINTINGVKSSKVLINLPQETVFVGEQAPSASASIVLELEGANTLDQQQINGLYHLASKSVPNLQPENIVIMDQNFTYYDQNEQGSEYASDNFSSQQKIKAQVEKDIGRQVQSLLGTMMGQNKVVVSVTTDIDFTKESRKEDLVEPVDKENMEGIAVSAERVTETYTGEGAQAGGVNGTGEDDITNYNEAAGGSRNGDYEKNEERINNEVNRVHKEIVESPYKIRDLGIQVVVEPPDPKNVQSLTSDREDDIRQILSTIVTTSINKDIESQPLTQNEIDNKIVVSVQPFDGKIESTPPETTSGGIPIWIYAAVGALLLIVILLLILLIRRKKYDSENEEEEIVFERQEPIFVEDVNDEKESEESVRRKQLEKMAKEKPEEFAKLLRGWLAEE